MNFFKTIRASYLSTTTTKNKICRQIKYNYYLGFGYLNLNRNFSSNNTTPPNVTNKKNIFYLGKFSALKFVFIYCILTSIYFRLGKLIGFYSLIFISIFFLFIVLFFIILDFYIFIYLINNKVSIPKYLPDFIFNYLRNLQLIISCGDAIIKIIIKQNLAILLIHSIVIISFIMIYHFNLY